MKWSLYNLTSFSSKYNIFVVWWGKTTDERKKKENKIKMGKSWEFSRDFGGGGATMAERETFFFVFHFT